LRLAVVSPFVDRRHGTERALAELLERLAQNEHCEIHLYSQRVEDIAFERPGTTLPPESGAIFWHKVPSIPGPHLLQFLSWLLLNSVCRAWDHLVHGLRFELVLSPGINGLDADVVIVHVLFHRLQELSGEEGGESAKLGLLRRFHRRAYYSLLTSLERRIYSNPSVTLCAVSQRTAALLARYFQRPQVPVVPHGVDSAQFSPAARYERRAEARSRRNLQDSDFVLLLIGNDWRVKGLETVLRALASLRSLPLHFIVAGDDFPDPFRESARRLGILERCHFERPRSEILDFYAAADLYVSPSLEDSFGMPAAEAMACGLPVITSTFAGVSDLIRNGVDGFVLLDPSNSNELARLLEELLHDPGKRERVGAEAAKTAREWSWDRNAAQVWKLLKTVEARKHSARAVRGEPQS
jgi:glycosyltransferase involved in cell wall biosynthesis